MIVKQTITRNCTQDCLAGVFLPFVHVVKFQFVSCVLLLVLSCLLVNCCWLTVCIFVVVLRVLLQFSCMYCCSCLACIVVVVLCVLLSYVYLLYCVGIAFFYFRCRTAGQKSVSGRSCDRAPRHRFFLVSLCPEANAEMVPKIPSCHYVLLVQPSRFKLSSNQFLVLFTCKITTATG